MFTTTTVVPSKTGASGRLARRLIDGSPAVRRAVRSPVAQRTIQALRASTELQPSSAIRLLGDTVRTPRELRLYTLRSGGKVCLRPRTDDLLTFNEVYHRGSYALPEGVRSILPPSPRVLDIGANIGMFTAWIAHELDCSVVAIEADQTHLPALEQSVRVNRLNAEVHCVAAATAPGVVRIASDFIHSHITTDGTGTTVQAIDVFPYLENADLVKMDIEGAEWPILSDPRMPGLPVRGWVMEWHATDAHPAGVAEGDAEQLLVAAGFRIIERYAESKTCGMLWAIGDTDSGKADRYDESSLSTQLPAAIATTSPGDAVADMEVG